MQSGTLQSDLFLMLNSQTATYYSLKWVFFQNFAAATENGDAYEHFFFKLILKAFFQRFFVCTKNVNFKWIKTIFQA